ncbi:hypothetical protein T492DRAFT_941828 [Pavlovales sp. CCMP2436]|nr:hypothetical protein T492DRAFT_941828 [Pavlovales sp. CCMP2436]
MYMKGMLSASCAGFVMLWLSPSAAFAGGGQGAVRPMARRAASLGHQLVRMKAAPTNGANVKAALEANRVRLDAMSSACPDVSELTRLRFALAFPIQSEALANLKETVAWRTGAGAAIVASAEAAVAKATAGGGWDNEPVLSAAPHAAVINRYISSKNILTLSTASGDLLYVIRASGIDDRAMMDKVSVPQMVEFFLYVKEVHSLVANERSARTGRLCGVVFANDVTGVRSIPDSRFSKALSTSSEQYEKLYPSMAGQTMILNLPFILQAFVGLIKPLFPKTVQDRLMFESAPVLAKLTELTPLTTDPTSRKSFLAEVTKLLR